jgi:hypothetical protein
MICSKVNQSVLELDGGSGAWLMPQASSMISLAERWSRSCFEATRRTNSRTRSGSPFVFMTERPPLIFSEHHPTRIIAAERGRMLTLTSTS